MSEAQVLVDTLLQGVKDPQKKLRLLEELQIVLEAERREILPSMIAAQPELGTGHSRPGVEL